MLKVGDFSHSATDEQYVLFFEAFVGGRVHVYAATAPLSEYQ